MLMNGVNELVTIAHYWREWSDPRLIVTVLADQDLNQVPWEQRALAGDPKFNASQHVPEFSFARYADLVGLIGIRVNRPEDVGQAWDEALAATCPVVLDIQVDPEVPTLPPHIPFAQARNFMTSVLSDPNASSMLKGSMKDALESILPHKD